MADAARAFLHVSPPPSASNELNEVLEALEIVSNALEQSIDDNFVTGQQSAALALADRIRRRYRTDALTKRGTADRSPGSASEAHDIEYWAATLGVPHEQPSRPVPRVSAMRPELARISEKA